MTNVTTLPSSQNSAATSSAEAPATQASAEPANSPTLGETVHESLQHLEDALHNPAVTSELAAQGKAIDLAAITQATELALAAEHPHDHDISRFDDDGGPHAADALKPLATPEPEPSDIVMGTGPNAKPVIETELGELVPESTPAVVPPVAQVASVAYDPGDLDILKQHATFPMSQDFVDALQGKTVAGGQEAAPGKSLAERVAELEATVVEFRKIMDHHGLRGPQS